MKLRKSKQIALCGILCALMVVTMLLGSIFPLTSILCPAIAGLFLIPVARECGLASGLMLYISVSLLSLLLVPDKEAALLFSLILGPYPLLRSYFNRISLKPFRIAAKLLFFNLLVTLGYFLLLFVLAPATFATGASDFNTITLLILLGMSNFVFLIYDAFLQRIAFLYEFKLRIKLFRAERH
jgi:hypothetical protein